MNIGDWFMNHVKDEGIQNPGKYATTPGFSKADCEKAIGFIIQKIDQNLEQFTAQFPAPASIHNVYPAIDNTDWTSSFWTGMLWLAYEMTGDPKYRRVAEIQLVGFKRRIEQKIAVDTHDLGFLYTLSCVAGYKLTGNEEAKQTALEAADLLMARYFEKAGIIQAWGDLKDPENRGRMIIDCCMNLPLLYWASQITRDQKYYLTARNHVNQAMKYIVREDASSYHTFYMDVQTGTPRYGKTAQGYSDSSCWARGQAWGIYGFGLSYLYTRDWRLVEMAKRLTHYFLNRLPADGICYWDLIFSDGDEERDSSAAAIAACGILEISKHLVVTDPLKRIYENAALYIIQSLTDHYTSKELPESNGILLHAVYAKPDSKGIDECNIWGDYFYFEALVRLVKDWQLYW